MGKIVVSEFLSLDGVMESPEKWQFPYHGEDMAAQIQADIQSSDALLFGRATYEEHSGFWPTQTNNEFGIADKLNSTPKYVVSTTLKQAEWKPSTIINTIEEVAKLKQQFNGNIGMSGSGNLIQSLIKADLVDEYRLFICPIVVGSGKRLFEQGLSQLPLKLVESKFLSLGVIFCVYQPDRTAS